MSSVNRPWLLDPHIQLAIANAPLRRKVLGIIGLEFGAPFAELYKTEPSAAFRAILRKYVEEDAYDERTLVREGGVLLIAPSPKDIKVCRSVMKSHPLKSIIQEVTLDDEGVIFVRLIIGSVLPRSLCSPEEFRREKMLRGERLEKYLDSLGCKAHEDWWTFGGRQYDLTYDVEYSGIEDTPYGAAVDKAYNDAKYAVGVLLAFSIAFQRKGASRKFVLERRPHFATAYSLAAAGNPVELSIYAMLTAFADNAPKQNFLHAIRNNLSKNIRAVDLDYLFTGLPTVAEFEMAAAPESTPEQRLAIWGVEAPIPRLVRLEDYADTECEKYSGFLLDGFADSARKDDDRFRQGLSQLRGPILPDDSWVPPGESPQG